MQQHTQQSTDGTPPSPHPVQLVELNQQHKNDQHDFYSTKRLVTQHQPTQQTEPTIPTSPELKRDFTQEQSQLEEQSLKVTAKYTKPQEESKGPESEHDLEEQAESNLKVNLNNQEEESKLEGGLMREAGSSSNQLDCEHDNDTPNSVDLQLQNRNATQTPMQRQKSESEYELREAEDNFIQPTDDHSQRVSQTNSAQSSPNNPEQKSPSDARLTPGASEGVIKQHIRHPEGMTSTTSVETAEGSLAGSDLRPKEEEKKSLAENYEEVVTSMQRKQSGPQTTIKDFSSLKVLGTGTYGKVMLVRHKKTQKLYAMKVLKKELIRKRNQVEHTKTERRVLERIRHPFIVRMKYAFKDREKLYFVLDYCHGGELFFYLTNLRRFKEDAARFYAANILLALRCLNQHNVVYRDLKPENVLIDAEGYALLTDFGLSKENITDSSRATSLCGTAEYLAPEVLEKERSYGKPCDWWSFGCVIYEMLTGHPPFYSQDRQQMFRDIKTQAVKFYDFHSSEARDLLVKLLVKDPAQRLDDPDVIMQHGFFGGINWDLMMARQVTTPYKPVLQDPTDTSHFDNQQTNIPVYSPPNPSTLASLYEEDTGSADEFNEFYFSPKKSSFEAETSGLGKQAYAQADQVVTEQF